MTDRTKTPPETPTALRAPSTGHVLSYVRSIQDDAGVPTVAIDEETCPECHHQHAGADVGGICIGCPCEWIRPQRAPTAENPKYHTFEYRDANRRLEAVPPDWYDGKPKRCPGSGQPPGVQFHGELSDDGEPKYLCRCPWCDKPFRPGPMPDHTFVPVNPEELTFREAGVLIGMEDDPPLQHPLESDEEYKARVRARYSDCIERKPLGITPGCDGDHPDPPCLSEQCHLKDPPIFTVLARARRVGDNVEFLCGACELPLSSEGSLYVVLEDEDQENPFVWHVSCAKKHAAEDQG
jgi:hypothetical protein